jgi:hypothetical protein
MTVTKIYMTDLFSIGNRRAAGQTVSGVSIATPVSTPQGLGPGRTHGRERAKAAARAKTASAARL